MLDPGAIQRIAVYPPLGIARVGNATGRDDHTIAPEVIGGLPTTPDGGFRDAQGAIRRQAARFRIYAFMRDGLVREVTADAETRIEWRVQLANLKAGWYAFGQAMDLPGKLSRPAQRRNAAIIGRQRTALDIRPSMASLSGPLAGAVVPIADGRFQGRPVYLGELRTDDGGRLLVLGGRGASAPRIANARARGVANNDGWHDDISDGPVRARVTIRGRVFEAEPGHVVVAPPNYAPGLHGVVTMDDIVREAFARAGWMERPLVTRFTADVWPIFDRMTGLQWVNHGAFMAHGHGSPLDARDGGVIAKLRDTVGEGSAASWRRRVLALFRAPDSGAPPAPALLPPVYGDSYGEPGEDTDPQARLTPTPTQYAHLQRWAAGDFTDDWPGSPPSPPDFATLLPEEQVAHLERAGLRECLGGPFHPGIELTWIMRNPLLWARPYRLKQLPEGRPVRQDYGTTLSPAACLAAGGPLDGVGPGSLTRWLGVPWQTDEASCNSSAEYTPSLYLSMPTYWGARVPDQVLSEAAHRRASDPRAPAMQRAKHLAHREDWMRDIRGGGWEDRVNAMIRDWSRLGIVAPARSTSDSLPGPAWVEQGRDPRFAGSDPNVTLITTIEHLNGEADTKAPPAQQHPPERKRRRGDV